MIEIHGILSSHAPVWWTTVDPWLEKALAHDGGRTGIEDVHRAIEACDMQLWLITDEGMPVAAVVTEIIQHPKTKILTVVLTGGSRMESWLAQLVDLLKRFGSANGCRSVEVHGRRGWVRALRQHGWREAYVTVSMEIGT